MSWLYQYIMNLIFDRDGEIYILVHRLEMLEARVGRLTLSRDTLSAKLDMERKLHADELRHFVPIKVGG